jgi:membrane associated rhomboid family serine protease
VLAGLILTCGLIELILQGADHGLWGQAYWRQLAYQNGGFWAGLLRDWRPNYALQPATMFVTYAFLHSGPGHLAGNMLGLWVLGQVALARLRPAGFLWLYLVSVLGGGLGFGLLSASAQPMVGASGALFGLAGAWAAWDWQAARASGGRIWPVLAAILALTLLNLLFWLAAGGLLAWETHLGGFVAGWAFVRVQSRFSRAAWRKPAGKPPAAAAPNGPRTADPAPAPGPSGPSAPADPDRR